MAAMDTILCHVHFGVVLVTTLFIYLVSFSATAASNGGFSVQLVHRNSPKSPFYNHNKTPMMSKKPQSRVQANNGQYLMKLSLGNPLFDVYGIADTGSDLLWAQCVPCEGCYKQIKPKFDPKKSSTYSDLPCGAQECSLVPNSCSTENVCSYHYEYGDGSVTRGVLAKETISLESTSEKGTVALKGIAFGCGHNNTGVFNQDDMGLIGLGGGPISFISQVAPLVGGKKFSYCLVPFHTDPSIESKMSFGKGSEVLGNGVVTVPLVPKDDTFYFVTVEGFSVGDKFLPFDSSGKVEKGNIFLDSGTPPTYIPTDLYDRLAAELRKQIPMAPIEDDPDLGNQLCYRTKTNLKGPILTVHFEGGANIKLTPTQTFIPPKDEVFCFAMIGDNSGVNIYGNFAQTNFLIGIDLETKVVSFKPNDCTKD
ncbi:aspartic proteinase CDR1 [Rosa chinensis]|nr:aspartic proteinase CDR1 [Rosa chinensis]